MELFRITWRLTTGLAQFDWKVAMDVLDQNFCYVINTTAFQLGQYEPSYTSTKELHGLANANLCHFQPCGMVLTSTPTY